MLYSCTRGFYAPSNMVLSVAGKITLAQAVDAASATACTAPAPA